MTDLLNNEPWHVEQCDCIEHMRTMPDASVDFAVFSPPFPSLFSYTSLPNDIGNSDDLKGEAKLHMSWFYKQLARVLKPGRVAMVHIMQIPGLARNGEIGTFDFRGFNIRAGRRAGLIYQYDWTVRKNPQAQAIRTHSHKLLFVTLERDRAISCGAFDDYLIKFIAPGENKVEINSPEISREEWIRFAEGRWDDISETDTLNVRGTKSDSDTRHICPLQLGVIERLIRLYSNPGEIVFSPFAGIGSEGYQAIRLGRRFYGCELKPEYHAACQINLAKAETLKAHDEACDLFAALEVA